MYGSDGGKQTPTNLHEKEITHHQQLCLERSSD